MLRQFNFGIDLSKFSLLKDERDAIAQEGEKHLFERFLAMGIFKKHGEIEGAVQRSHRRVLEKLDATADSTILLEEAEYDLVKSAFSSAAHPGHTRIVSWYANAVETARSIDQPQAA